MKPVVIHTDGSASTKDKTGGWGFVARYNGDQQTRSGCADGTTISVMEILAINKALHFLRPNAIPVSIFSDSKYAVNSLTEWGPVWEKEGWITSTGKQVSNIELIKATMRLIERHRRFRKVEISWVKGHAGNESNEIADRLAGEARRAKRGTWRPEDKKFDLLVEQIEASKQ